MLNSLIYIHNDGGGGGNQTRVTDLKGRTKSNESDKTSRACVSRCHR